MSLPARLTLLALGVGATALVVSLVGRARDPYPLFQARVYRDGAGNRLPYRLLRPKVVEAGRQYPLVIFFHGSDERGSDNTRQLSQGVLGFASDERIDRYPCFVVVPQCMEGGRWVDTYWSADSHELPEKPTEPMRLSLELIDELRRGLPVDEKRLYAVGVSMGGFGVWDALMRRPELFAAGVPVCGGADDTKAARIARVPVWAFHGAQDRMVRPKRSRGIVAALRRAGGKPRHTEYPDVGHVCWTRTFQNPELYEWLFAQRRE